MRLVIDGFGKFVGRENELIVVKEKGKITRKIKPDELKQVVFCGKAAISTDAIALLLRNSVDVVFLSRKGEITGRLAHPFIGTAKTRREQYLAYDDWRGTYLAKEFISAKIKNQAAILNNLAKSRKDSNPNFAEKLRNCRTEVLSVIKEVSEVEGKIDNVREEIMGLEGKASKIYWDAIAAILPEEYGFEGRRGLMPGQTRYAQDIVNASLNYGYAILHSECVRAVELAGLDVYAGFLHSDRAGRTSLALDLMEEFRQQLVDRIVLRLIFRKQLKVDSCEISNFTCILKDEARKLLLSEVLKRLDTKTQFEGRNYKFSAIIMGQARKIASFLRGERKRYTGFWQSW